MGLDTASPVRGGALDLAITNVTIVDAIRRRKADVGMKDGKIVGIGKAGNPGTMDGRDARAWWSAPPPTPFPRSISS